jgi:hypothetical protein
LTVVVASLIAVFLVSLVIVFTVGFICGQWFDRKFKEPPNQASGAHPPRGPPVPIYECIAIGPDTTHEEQVIELEENVAYGPSIDPDTTHEEQAIELEENVAYGPSTINVS